MNAAPRPAATEAPRQDLRVRRTRALLWEALQAEMTTRPFEEISVTDICERAMVHRTTFYKHYEDKYALLDQGMRQMLDAVVGDGDHLPPDAYPPGAPPPYVTRLFEQAARHQRFYRLMVCGEGNGRFQRLVREYIVTMAATAVPHGPRHPAGARDQPPADALAMHAYLVAGAALSLLAWWLENGMRQTPREMARYLMAPHGQPERDGRTDGTVS